MNALEPISPFGLTGMPALSSLTALPASTGAGASLSGLAGIGQPDTSQLSQEAMIEQIAAELRQLLALLDQITGGQSGASPLGAAQGASGASAPSGGGGADAPGTGGGGGASPRAAHGSGGGHGKHHGHGAHHGRGSHGGGGGASLAGGRPQSDGGGVNAGLGTHRAKATSYYPSNDGVEGGYVDTKGHKLNTLQDYLSGKAPYVSVALDANLHLPYGAKLRIPELEKKYGRPIEFRAVDTFDPKNGPHEGFGRIDICTQNKKTAYDEAVNGMLTLEFQ
ncbi:MAG: hypothetical protein EB084_18730 [Proteobacteria bacterium]|nr:hypothetical protein [Pseudomonadota bacterium]